MTDFNEDLMGPLPGLGFGGVVGFVVGYTAKKISKIAAFVLGGVAILAVVLQAMGWVTIHWGVIEPSAKRLVVDSQGVTLADRAWQVLIANVPFGGGFVAGFALGFKVA